MVYNFSISVSNVFENLKTLRIQQYPKKISMEMHRTQCNGGPDFKVHSHKITQYNSLQSTTIDNCMVEYVDICGLDRAPPAFHVEIDYGLKWVSKFRQQSSHPSICRKVDGDRGENRTAWWCWTKLKRLMLRPPGSG